jgi:hypothetical protein
VPSGGVPYDKEEIRMLDPDPSFHRVGRRDGHLSLEDLDLMEDGRTTAPAGSTGSPPVSLARAEAGMTA